MSIPIGVLATFSTRTYGAKPTLTESLIAVSRRPRTAGSWIAQRRRLRDCFRSRRWFCCSSFRSQSSHAAAR